MSEINKMEDSEAQSYVPDPNAEDISPSNDGGIMKSIIQPGEGDENPKTGDCVYVHYTGKLTDGTKFDSSVDRGEEFKFTLGKGEVIKAWDIGVATMKKGEKCILVCQSDYAYGKQGSPPKIPAEATLVFEVELIRWQMEDLTSEKNGGVLRSIIKAGEGYYSPSEGSTVEVHLVGKCSGKVFEERDVKYQIGEAVEANVVEGIDIALKKFNKGEQSKICLTPKYAFGTEGNTELNVPANSPVEYEVTLNNFEKVKESWEMSAEEKLEQSEIVKNKGTKYFKEGKYKIAVKQYNRIINYLASESELDGENKEKKNSLLLAGYLNLAACYLKLEEYLDVIENCEKALELDSKNSKGLFRKGQAYLAEKDYEPAKICFAKVLEIEPSNKAAQKELYVCNDNLKKQLQKEKKMYQNIFKKLTEEKSEEQSVTENGTPQENIPSKN